MARNNVMSGLNVDFSESISTCESFIVAKTSRAPAPKQGGEREKKPSELLHSDIYGPMHVGSLEGSRYFATFIDDHSRFCFMYMLKTKNEVLHVSFKWLRLFQNQYGSTVKSISAHVSVLRALRTDNGCEY